MPALSLRDRGLAPVAAATFVVAGGLLLWALFFGGADSPTRLAWIGGAAVIAAAVLAAAALAGSVARPRLERQGIWCVAILAALAGCVIAYALLAKGIPSLYPDYGRLARLRSPVGFWNALALVGDFAVVLGLWRASERRFYGALLVFGGVLTVLLAYSRGGILVGVLAAGAWLWLDARRLEALAALVVGGGAAVAVFGISLVLHGVSDDGQPHS